MRKGLSFSFFSLNYLVEESDMSKRNHGCLKTYASWWLHKLDHIFHVKWLKKVRRCVETF